MKETNYKKQKITSGYERNKLQKYLCALLVKAVCSRHPSLVVHNNVIIVELQSIS